MIRITSLLFGLAVVSAVPVVKQGSNSGWSDSNQGSNTDWNWGNTDGDKTLETAITKFDIFALFKQFFNTGPSDDQARTANMKDWINQQYPEDRAKYLKAWDDLMAYYNNIWSAVNLGTSRMPSSAPPVPASAEVRTQMDAIQRLYDNESLTINQVRSAVHNIVQSMPEKVKSELTDFLVKVEKRYVQQFGIPKVDGKPIFEEEDSKDTNNSGWGNNNSNSGGWGDWNNKNSNKNNNNNNGWGDNNGANSGWDNNNKESSGWGANTNSNNGWGSVGGGDQGWNNGKTGSPGWNSNQDNNNDGGWGKNTNQNLGGWGNWAAPGRSGIPRAAIGKGVEPVKKA